MQSKKIADLAGECDPGLGVREVSEQDDQCLGLSLHRHVLEHENSVYLLLPIPNLGGNNRGVRSTPKS